MYAQGSRHSTRCRRAVHHLSSTSSRLRGSPLSSSSTSRGPHREVSRARPHRDRCHLRGSLSTSSLPCSSQADTHSTSEADLLFCGVCSTSMCQCCRGPPLQYWRGASAGYGRYNSAAPAGIASSKVPGESSYCLRRSCRPCCASAVKWKWPCRLLSLSRQRESIAVHLQLAKSEKGGSTDRLTIQLTKCK